MKSEKKTAPKKPVTKEEKERKKKERFAKMIVKMAKEILG